MKSDSILLFNYLYNIVYEPNNSAMKSNDFSKGYRDIGNRLQFKTLIGKLVERKRCESNEKVRLQQYIDLLLSTTPNIVLVFDMERRAVLASEAYYVICKINQSIPNIH